MRNHPNHSGIAGILEFLKKIGSAIRKGSRRAAIAVWDWLRSVPGKIKRWAVRWYSFNKQKIPMIFILIAGFVFDYHMSADNIAAVKHRIVKI